MIKGSGGATIFGSCSLNQKHNIKIWGLCSSQYFQACNLMGSRHNDHNPHKRGSLVAVWLRRKMSGRRTTPEAELCVTTHSKRAKNRQLNPHNPSTNSNWQPPPNCCCRSVFVWATPSGSTLGWTKMACEGEGPGSKRIRGLITKRRK